MEHKSEENAKDLIFHAENSTWRRQEEDPDGVKSKSGDDPVQTWRRHKKGVKSIFGDGLHKVNTWRRQTQI